MVTIREGMVQLNVPIPEDLRDMLDSEIIKRCGYPKRGILGEVVTEALREFLYKRHTHTQQHKDAQATSQTQKKEEALPNNNNRLPQRQNTNVKYEYLKRQIKRYGDEHNYKIHYSMLEDIIRQMFGNDKRTLNKYIELLENDFFVVPETDDGTYLTPKPLIHNTNNNIA